MDPLIRLPVEVNVGILTLCSPSDILRLEAVSQTWKAFIKEHEAHIWAAAAIAHEFKTADVMQERLGHSALGQADLKTFLSSKWSFQRDTWSSVHTWREYSRRKTLLHRNLNSTRPVMARRHMMCRVPHVWRMRPDFEAGLLICTSERGGLQVYDLESSERLWSLSADQILPYAHLEHSQGTLALNPGIDDTIEIWRRADLVPDRPAQYVRGQYIKVASLPHDAPLRGWHLLFPTLCVVSDEGKAWIHDVAADPPILQRTLEIPRGARGHLEQDDSIVMYAMKRMGYHIYDKSSGKHLGNLDPSVWNLSHSNFFKVKPRQCSERGTSICFCTTQLDFTSIASATKPGPLWSEDQAAEDYDASFGHRDLSQIEWGAGMIHGKIMVGVSQSPWVMIVSDWPAVMRDPSKASDYVSFLLHEECQTSQVSTMSVSGMFKMIGRVALLPMAARATPSPDGSCCSGG